MKKIKEEQLNKIKTHQIQVTELLNKIGYFEAQKHSLLHELNAVNSDVDSFKKELEKEYGAVNINIEDGTYTEIEKKELEKVES